MPLTLGSLAKLYAPTAVGDDGAGGILITGGLLCVDVCVVVRSSTTESTTMPSPSTTTHVDNSNRAIRRLLANGTLITVAGVAGQTAFNGDWIPATTANLGNPFSTLLDPGGDGFLIADETNRIRQARYCEQWTIPGMLTLAFANAGLSQRNHLHGSRCVW